ncbi:unnamed protein product [marine sediment metagenome]|uniref:Uncharacterized protein n=1 Tax=marine sediment metagenome TaxID=412755 RepID=X1DXR6_9ZZZZ
MITQPLLYPSFILAIHYVAPKSFAFTLQIGKLDKFLYEKIAEKFAAFRIDGDKEQFVDLFFLQLL